MTFYGAVPLPCCSLVRITMWKKLNSITLEHSQIQKGEQRTILNPSNDASLPASSMRCNRMCLVVKLASDRRCIRQLSIPRHIHSLAIHWRFRKLCESRWLRNWHTWNPNQIEWKWGRDGFWNLISTHSMPHFALSSRVELPVGSLHILHFIMRAGSSLDVVGNMLHRLPHWFSILVPQISGSCYNYKSVEKIAWL